MSDFFHMKNAAQLCHCVIRCIPALLADVEHSVQSIFRHQPTSFAPCSLRIAEEMLLIIS